MQNMNVSNTELNKTADDVSKVRESMTDQNDARESVKSAETRIKVTGFEWKNRKSSAYVRRTKLIQNKNKQLKNDESSVSKPQTRPKRQK